jgi:uncharacterized membrane protein
MSLMIAGLLIFLGVHFIGAFAPAWRERMRARIGPGGWKGLYAVISLIGFVLIVKGYALARLTPAVIYTSPTWLRHIVLLLMVPVFPLIFAAYLPGKIKARLKHPMLDAVKLWATAHLLANGTLADIILFASFLAWAIIVRASFKRRPPQVIATAPPRPWNDALAILLGLALYVVTLLWLHLKVIGVSPLA